MAIVNDSPSDPPTTAELIATLRANVEHLESTIDELTIKVEKLRAQNSPERTDESKS